MARTARVVVRSRQGGHVVMFFGIPLAARAVARAAALLMGYEHGGPFYLIKNYINSIVSDVILDNENVVADGDYTLGVPE